MSPLELMMMTLVLVLIAGASDDNFAYCSCLVQHSDSTVTPAAGVGDDGVTAAGDATTAGA